jgi:beta-phosphoglucomutase-like phosphatase (HAD superfamily)
LHGSSWRQTGRALPFSPRTAWDSPTKEVIPVPDKGKPAADIYEKAKSILGLKPEECIVIEDSVNGIKAGLGAGMYVFAVANLVTKEPVHAFKILAPEFLLDSSEDLIVKIYRFIDERNEALHPG